MSGQPFRLDGAALYNAVDAKRGKEVSWRALGRDLGISQSTFTRLKDGHDITGDTLVTLLVWLDLDTDIIFLIRPREPGQVEQ